MLIDFDGLTIIIGIVIYILICIFIHKKYKKEKIYYVFSTIMFCYFMCIAKLTLCKRSIVSTFKISIHLS